jgi:hypothetical protein
MLHDTSQSPRTCTLTHSGLGDLSQGCSRKPAIISISEVLEEGRAMGLTDK